MGKNWEKKYDNKEAFIMKNGADLLEQLIASSNGKYNPILGFSTEELKIATNNYDERYLIKEDFYFQKVYKGFLQDRSIFVMKFDHEYPMDSNAYQYYFNNIAFASQMRHKNILKLIGCCLETQLPILVFESVDYMTLDYHICGLLRPHFDYLLLTQRLKIAMEIANAVAYLHVGFSRPIVFFGIRASTILLDEEYVPKLCDFSVAESIPEGETRIKRLIGRVSSGEIGPDHLDERTDVYSFSALLFVLLSGQRIHEFMANDRLGHENTPKRWFWEYLKKYNENYRYIEIVDPRTAGNGQCLKTEQQLQTFAKLMFKCISESADN
ncbi:hypothetical protein LWI28_028421 [Acer negundo]|uniref:Protein kinase domain-containing protein n=1 Tax=Acer negundo TaxID=4023 RepID=A0AAD5J8T9_ACENE|nr:hypothetical protein LWI28_028421 [Acer negundo]